jgi:type IV fimbrial biogenesis protein FimT
MAVAVLSIFKRSGPIASLPQARPSKVVFMGIRSTPVQCINEQLGFTLFELLIVIGIVAVTAAIGVPAMRQYLQNYQGSSAASNLVTSINYARSEAIKEDLPTAGGGGITICASTGAGAPPTCDSANWASGWIVISSNPLQPQPLQRVGALPANVTLTVTPANAAVLFQPNGTAPALVAGANGRAIFKLCDSRGPGSAREVEVSVTGIIQAASQLGRDVGGAAVAACP